MDETESHHNPNPVMTANPLSRLFFWWMTPFMKKGYGKTLEVEDMYNVCPEERSEVLGDKLEKAWEKEVQRMKGSTQDPSLLRALFRIYSIQYILLLCLLLIEEAIKVIQPLLLGVLITYFTPNPSITSTTAYLYAGGISICTVLLAVIHHPCFFSKQRMGMKIRIACCSLMYRKCLRLSSLGYSKTTSGQIVNLMSNDINKIYFAVMMFPYVIVGPVVIVAVIVILWKEVGVSTLAGIAVVAFFIIMQAMMARLFSKFREKTAQYTDKRVTLMNEIIVGIRIIKIYCWERSFGKLIEKIRSSEVHSVRVTSFLSAILETFARYGNQLCLYAIILSFTMDNQHFRASDLYITVGIVNILSANVFLMFSLGVRQTIQMAVTVERIQRFLLLEELSNSMISGKQDPENANKSACLIEMKHVSAKWNETLEHQTLENITASVRARELLIVIGPVGAGKSSMLMAVLREIPLLDGNVCVKGRLAYVSQQPWVFSASLRQNIVFGNKLKKARYKTILTACALDKDIACLPYGDRTIIGDRGVKLSGGQRSRISLARALYIDADIYLLDDPFSSIDANVGEHIFTNVIHGILKEKPRILVTHQLRFLHAANQIIILKEGKIVRSDTYDGLSIAGIDFGAIVNSKNERVHRAGVDHFLVDGDNHMYRTQETKKFGDINSTDGFKNNNIVQISESVAWKPEAVQIQSQEDVSVGTVNWRVYYKYLKSGAGILKCLVLTCACIAAQAAFISSDWWLSQWSNENESWFAEIEKNRTMNDTRYTTTTTLTLQSKHNLMVYSGLIGGAVIFGLMRGLLFFKVATDASQKLHNSMFTCIIRGRIGFFDNNPIGRILNRFSKDVGLIDEVLPLNAFDFLQCFLLVVSYVLVAGVVNPWTFIAITPLSAVFFLLRYYHLRTSRQVQRLEGTTRSPVFTHVSASLQGLYTIRAFGTQDKFIKEFDDHQDLHTEAWFLVLATTRWLAVRLDWIYAVFVISVSFSSVFAATDLDAGRVGFSMTYAMTLITLFQWMVRQSSLVENQMVSVERVLEYSQLPSEAQLETEEEQKPPRDWPQQGEIISRNVYLKYTEESPYILKDLSFTIHPRQKIGVIGRTGAGKSSLITMFTRLVEAEGDIFIDRTNIKNLGLHELRSNISIIPQDPILFSGTLRRNLDPFESHNDISLWKALAEVELKPVVEALLHGLDTEVAEGGTNLSVGQRQLICLARAILKHNKLLIIDEATANVDPITDQVIQKTIREKFHDCTVLTIAHRLHTVMDSDKLLVLDEGQLAEFDSPYLLLQNCNSFLHSLVNKMGNGTANELLEITKSAYQQKNIH